MAAVKKPVITKQDREAFARIGAIGGRARGACKRRGDSAFYAELAKKRIAKHGK